MIILVCGGREFDDWSIMDMILSEHTTLDTLENTFIQGGAKGADFLCRVWCKYTGHGFSEYPADWKQYGKAAGGIRNQQMLDEGKPDLVIAFQGGVGTADMVRRSKKAGVKVIEV